MDERELVGLLYRADWTRLTLAGSVRGAAGSVLSLFGLNESWDIGRDGIMPRPPLLTPDLFDGDVALDLAPGRRFRLRAADGRWAGGCDGTRVWQWLADLPADVTVGFSARPQPPLEQLLAPSWLLTGHTLTVREPATVGGRAGIAISAVPAADGRRVRPAGRAELPPQWRWHLDGRYERVVAVVDATLGFLLRCEFQFGDKDAAVAEFTGLAIGAETDPAVFTAPAGSLYGDGAEPDGLLGGMLGRSGLDAAKTVAGLAAGGLGAVIKYGPSRRVDPFGVATAETADPDRDLPADEPLPAWATGDAGPEPEPAGPGEAGGTPVSDDLLRLLYRGGVDLVPFTATLHEWTDGESLLAAVPPSARRAGFGGVGFLLDAVRNHPDLDGPTFHTAHEIRVGGWDRYRMDRVTATPAARPGRHDRARITLACDGSRCWEVYQDRVEVGPAAPLPDAPAELADGSWLLRCLLADGEEVVADGRPGYRIIATARPGGIPPLWNGWPGLTWLPAVAVVDAATGRLLRLTRYLGGRPARRLEFRTLADGGPDDFGFTPPEGLRVTDRPGAVFSGPAQDAESGGPPPPGWPPADGLEFGDAAGVAADAIRQRVDEKVAAARGFLGSLLGGPRAGR